MYMKSVYAQRTELLEILLRYNRDDIISLPRLHAHLQAVAEELTNEDIQVWLH